MSYKERRTYTDFVRNSYPAKDSREQWPPLIDQLVKGEGGQKLNAPGIT